MAQGGIPRAMHSLHTDPRETATVESGRMRFSEEERLERKWEAFAKLEPVPFERGVNDCCTWAAGWASVMMGKKVACDWLGKRLTDDEALAIIQDEGGLMNAVDAVLLPLGWEVCEPATEAPPYSIVAIPSCGGLTDHTLGIVRGERVLVRGEPKGRLPAMMRLVVKDMIERAWVWG